MNSKKIIFIALIFSFTVGCSLFVNEKSGNEITFKNNTQDKKIDVLVNGSLFTSFIYNDNLSVLKKTVLFPLIAANGVSITRGYPLDPKPNERIDHPHHIGAWLNYGNVNGLDFWNNSDAIPETEKDKMGTIRLDKILKMQDGKNEGLLEVSENWLNSNNKTILKEKTDFRFIADENSRIIDRIVTLTAQNEKVIFNDNKEGMVAIRVARQLEHPSKDPVTLSDAQGRKTDVPVLDNTGVTGHYLSSEGIEGDDVWSTRARWVSLDGNIEGKNVTVVIFDNPKNVGFPTYWHARGYGLFAANPLGQNVFSKGKETLNFTLNAGESVTFRYRILLQDGKMDKEKIEKCYSSFVSSN